MQRRDVLQAAAAAAATAPLGLGGLAHAQPAATAPYRWQALPFGGGGAVGGLLFHPREPGLLVLRSDSGAWRHDAASGRWQALLNHLGRADGDLASVLSLAVDPREPQRLYAACGAHTADWARRAALLASEDRGATWTVHELGLRLGGREAGRGSGERLQVDPLAGEVLYLGSTRDGLLRSDDRGRRFRALPFAGRQLTLVLPDPSGGSVGRPCTRLWVGCHDQPGLYRSDDSGARFQREDATPAQTPQRAALGRDGSLLVSFAAGPEAHAPNPGNAQAGSVWRRTPDGRWSDVTPVRPAPGSPERSGGFGWGAVAVDPADPRRLLAASLDRWAEGDELFLSEDGGERWQPLGPRSRFDDSAHPWLAAHRAGSTRPGWGLTSLAFDPHAGGHVVCGHGLGVWRTRELAAAAATPLSWRFDVAGLELAPVQALLSPSGGATVMAAMAGVGGAAWDDLGQAPAAGLFRPVAESNRSVDAAWLAPRVVARSANGVAGGQVSLDGGVGWRAFGAAGVPPRRPGAEGGQVAVSASGGALLWAAPGQPALASADRGRSWQPVQGWPAGGGVPVADRGIEGVFYVLDREAGEVRISVDGGRRFTPVVTGLPRLQGWQSAQLLSVPGQPRELWLGLHDTLLHLPGADRPARTIAAVLHCGLLALGRGAEGGAPQSLYVWGRVRLDGGEAEGLFRSDDGGARFRAIDDPQHRFGRLVALAADPLEHGTVYLAPQGRGVVVGRPAA